MHPAIAGVGGGLVHCRSVLMVGCGLEGCHCDSMPSDIIPHPAILVALRLLPTF